VIDANTSKQGTIEKNAIIQCKTIKGEVSEIVIAWIIVIIFL
jgi:hypothetical protein